MEALVDPNRTTQSGRNQDAIGQQPGAGGRTAESHKRRKPRKHRGFLKQGGRDSNPPPPDRQSTGRMPEPTTKRELARHPARPSSADRSARGRNPAATRPGRRRRSLAGAAARRPRGHRGDGAGVRAGAECAEMGEVWPWPGPALTLVAARHHRRHVGPTRRTGDAPAPQFAIIARVGQRRSPGGMCRGWRSLAMTGGGTQAAGSVGTSPPASLCYARGNSRGWRQSLFALSEGSRGLDPLPPARTQDWP